jgi:hypothetical protein
MLVLLNIGKYIRHPLLARTACPRQQRGFGSRSFNSLIFTLLCKFFPPLIFYLQ